MIVVNMSTGVKENSDPGNFVFTNPSKGYFTLSTKNLNIITRLEIYDALGSHIKTQKVNDNKVIVDLRSESNGIYWFNVREVTGRTVVLKIIKEEDF